MANIAVLGYGTVGSGVVEVINTNRKNIESKADDNINIKYVLDLREFPDDPVQKILTHDFEDIINDDTIDVVVEVMGGTKPAFDFVKRSLEAGKSVCTSNKELVAAHGDELMAIAQENNVNFLFEASVGGGIPIIRPINRSITSDKILKIMGILNGTTNYMLTKMSREGLDYGDVLKDAQQKGYAERNPAADVEGFDACRKIAILTSLATGKRVDFNDIPTEGITNIGKKDIEYVNKMGASIKLLASADLSTENIWARVAPTIIMQENPLSSVNDVFNAILLEGNMLGEVMFYGKGAGKLATAAAVVSDIVEAIKHKGINLGVNWSKEKQELSDINEVEVRELVRVSYEDENKAKEGIISLFGEAAFIDLDEKDDEFAFLTRKMREGSLKEKLGSLERSGSVKKVLNNIRVEG